MRYLCLVHGDPAAWEKMSKMESRAFDDEHIAYDDTLKAGGHLVANDALEPAENATIVRVRDGRISTTDGPFAETKEQLGGFILIEARDLNEAIRLAAGIPSARLGSIEVRAVRYLR
jgi:hypothetical protein